MAERDRVFIDTNVFVYAADEDAGDKRDHARLVINELIASGRAVISTQVLQEYFAAATRKLRISAQDARETVASLAQLDVVLLRPELVLAAIDLHRLHQLSIWDALIIRSAATARCERLLSEDLQDGQMIDGVRIENPFLAITK